MQGGVAARRQKGATGGATMRRPIAREIGVALFLKIIALAAIYGLFFSPSHRITVGPAQMVEAISARP